MHYLLPTFKPYCALAKIAVKRFAQAKSSDPKKVDPCVHLANWTIKVSSNFNDFFLTKTFLEKLKQTLKAHFGEIRTCDSLENPA